MDNKTKKAKIQEEARHLKSLSRDLMSYSRLDESEYKANVIKLTSQAIYTAYLRVEELSKSL